MVSLCTESSSGCNDAVLDRDPELEKIGNYIQKLKNNKTGGSDVLGNLVLTVCASTVEGRPYCEPVQERG